MTRDRNGELVLNYWSDLGVLMCCGYAMWPVPYLWAASCLNCGAVSCLSLRERSDP